MTIQESGDLAVITSRNHFAVMSDADTGRSLYEAIAKLARRGGGEPSFSEWQVLDDLLEALADTFGPASSLEPVRPEPVCQIPACGCSGSAHP